MFLLGGIIAHGLDSSDTRISMTERSVKSCVTEMDGISLGELSLSSNKGSNGVLDASLDLRAMVQLS